MRQRSGLRLLTRLALVLVILLSLALSFPTTGRAAHNVGPDRVYFPETGHVLKWEFLDYWRHNGGIGIFGYPITEEFTDPVTKLTQQYFERAVFQWYPDAPAAWQVQLARLGAERVAGRNDGALRSVVATDNNDCTFFEQTGHRLCFGFRNYWNDNGGLPVFGYPLSEEFVEGGYTVQYFERARFEWHPEHRGTAYEILLGRLGADAAVKAGVDQTPLPEPSEIKRYEPGLWYVPTSTQPQAGRPGPGAPSGRAQWIEVNLTAQYLRAWEYDTVVFGQYISSGTAAYPTVTGTFSIYWKLPSQDMTNGRAAPPSEYYYVPDVPWVMYFYQDYALHGAYWHNSFGVPRSHGCVNMSVSGASWLYDWAPLGTTVWIHY